MDEKVNAADNCPLLNHLGEAEQETQKIDKEISIDIIDDDMAEPHAAKNKNSAENPATGKAWEETILQSQSDKAEMVQKCAMEGHVNISDRHTEVEIIDIEKVDISCSNGNPKGSGQSEGFYVNEIVKDKGNILNGEKNENNISSRVQVLSMQPLCADYASSESDSDVDSDSDSDSDLDSDSSSDDSEESDTSDSENSLSDNSKMREDGVPVEKTKTKKERTRDLSLSDLPPIENLHITVPEDQCIELGVITSIVDTLVLVESFKGAPALDIETVLFLEKGNKTLGKIFDVLGPVTEPLYAVRFNTLADIAENNIIKGLKVYCAPKTEYTSFIFVSELMKMKGSDASWKNNEEPPPECQDFSDDELEHNFQNMMSNSAAASSSEELSNRKKAKVNHSRFNKARTSTNRNPAAFGSARGTSPRLRHPPPFSNQPQHPLHRFPGNPFCNSIQTTMAYHQRYPLPRGAFPNYNFHTVNNPRFYQPYGATNQVANMPPQYCYPQFSSPPPPPPPMCSNPGSSQFPQQVPPNAHVNPYAHGLSFSPGAVPRTMDRVFGTDVKKPS